MSAVELGTSQVGRSFVRREAAAKLTGRAEYVHDLELPRMLHGKVVRSTIAHATIRRIDTRAAAALEGVHRVLTGDDIRSLIPDPHYGPAFHDQPILAFEKIRYAGEPVVLVLASDPHVAQSAAELVEIDYDPLPAVYDEVEAMSSQALVHAILKPAGTFPDLKHLEGRRGTNVALDFHLRRGDAAQAFAQAEHVFEHTFKTQQVLHLPLEPFVSIADPAGERLTLHTASQSPSFVRIEIARLLGWPENRVRVCVPFLGGGFGAKLYIKLEALVAAAALIVRAAGEDRAVDGRAVLYAHQARGNAADQERGGQGRSHTRARVRSVVERRRVCGHRSARDAEIRLHRRGSVRHRACAHRLLRALYESAAGRRACADSAYRSWCGPTKAMPT